MIASTPTQPKADIATEILWREFSAPLRKFLLARTQTSADAEDLLQEVFVRIQKRLPDLREPAKLQGWIYRIARNAVIDHYRTRRQHLPLDFESEATDPEGRNAVDLTSSLRKFIAALPPAYREPLVRHEYQGESLQAYRERTGADLDRHKKPGASCASPAAGHARPMLSFRIRPARQGDRSHPAGPVRLLKAYLPNSLQIFRNRKVAGSGPGHGLGWACDS